MADILNNIEELVDKDEKLIDIWGRRTPKFEKRYSEEKNSVLRVLSDYGVGASSHTEAKGKVFGAGYEPLIIAYFIGLYSNKRLPLSDDPDEIKDRGCGQPIQYWGNLDSKKYRHAYPKLRSYIFISLIARTDIDWIAIDKGDIKVSTAISKLMETMEEYINYGLSVMAEKLNKDSSFFFSNRSFLDMFLQLTDKYSDQQDEEDDEVEDL